jgi:hypothetical protein
VIVGIFGSPNESLLFGTELLTDLFRLQFKRLRDRSQKAQLSILNQSGRPVGR